MATIVYPVAAFTSGLNVFKWDGRLWKMMNVRAGQDMLHEFIRKEPKTSLKYMESELGISTVSIYRILTENLGYIKVCAKFVPHSLKPHEKDLINFDYLTKNRNHSPYSPVMAPCDFYLFGKLHLAMKGKRYADADAIQKASTAILNAIPKNDPKKSFDNLLDRENRCIQCEGDYFEGYQ